MSDDLCHRSWYQDEHGEWRENTLRDPQPDSIRQIMKILLEGTAHGALLADEQGLGKTATSIIAVYSLRELVGGYLRIAVVGPKNVLADWKKEIIRWQAHPDLVITLKNRHSIDPETVKRGWLLVSYDTVGHYFPPARRSKMPPFDLLIIDESYHLKEPTIKRTNMIYGGTCKKRHIPPIPAKKVICISGTPLKNRIEEIFTAIHHLDPERWPDRRRFINGHYIEGHLVDNKGRVTGAPDPAAIDRLRETLRSSILVRHRKDPYLPRKQYERIWLSIFDLGERSLAPTFKRGRRTIRIINSTIRRALAMKDWQTLAELKEKLNQKQERMREMTGSAKFRPLLSYLLEKARTTNGKLVVFLYHDDLIQGLAENVRSAGYGCVTLTGDTRDSQVPRRVFKEDGSCRFFIGNLGAAGVGITLVESAHVVFGEIPWTPAEWMQAQDRVHRFGQTREVTVTTFLLREGYDAEMFDTVRRKTRILRQVLDPDWDTDEEFTDREWRSKDGGEFELVP
jgi:SWI/SNF-related matrix-associated actin-dependent regulator of chromatin subfamily A-like protein 1